MKKRIVMSVIITVLFAIIIVTSSFIALVNMKDIEQTKDILELYNNFFILGDNNNDIDLTQYKINGHSIRFTVINTDGTIIFDTVGELVENHLDREEIVEALRTGKGSSVRYSKTAKTKMVYYATKNPENIIVRSSVPVGSVKIFTSSTLKYYIFIVFLVVLLSLALSYKLVKIIIQPVKELEFITSKIAGGDLNKRAKIYNYDEIGSLAKTFNNMAEQLQLKINDSYDKQDKLEAILESMDSGVIAIDSTGSIILINPYAKKIFGLKGDIIGRKIADCIIDYDLINFLKCLPEINSREIKLFHPIDREIRVKKAPIISRSKRPIGIVVTIADITDIRRLENMRSQFVANVSHELKTPLTSIKGFSETLKYVDDETTKNKFLDIINKEAERLTRLINDILVLSNIENLHRMVEEKFNPSETIKEVIDIVSIEAEQQGISIVFNNEFSGELTGDRDKFFQLILNLVENSVKYSGVNSIITINTKERKEHMIFEVIDNGMGIPKEDLPRIFERFYRVDKSRATKGTGLGLAIVKHIVKLFDGEINVASKLGEGTTFQVKIRKYEE